MKKTKKIIVLLLTTILLFNLMACTAKKDSTADTEVETQAEQKETKTEETGEQAEAEESNSVVDGVHAEVIGKVIVAQHRTDLENEFAAMIAAFNEIYPNVEVEVESVANYQDTMAVRIAGGEMPDVLEIRDIMIPAASWSQYFASLEDCNLPDMLFSDFYTVDGVLYGACESVPYYCMIYNKTLYAKAGIESVPTTYDEFMDAMQKLKDIGVIPLTSQYNTTWTQRSWIDHLAASLNKNGWKNTWVDTDTPFSDETIRYACDLYKGCIDNGYCEEDLMSSDWDLQAADFAAGTIGTYCAGTYVYGTMVGLGMDPSEIGFYAYPVADYTKDGVCTDFAGVDWAWGLSKDVVESENYEAACALVNFLACNYASYINTISAVIGAESVVEAFNELEATKPALRTQVADSEDFTGINTIAAITIGNFVQEYVVADDPQTVVDAYNAKWAAARAEYYNN